MNTVTRTPDAALAEQLHKLYHDSSKHSVYQSVPPFVARALGYQEEIHSLWRSDQPRYDFISAHLALPPGAVVADVGANTGFFTLNLAQANPGWRLTAYELNPRHAEFIRLIAEGFDLSNVSVRPQSCDFAGLAALPQFDALLLLNIVHHAGFDFDCDLADDNAAYTAYVIAYLRRLRSHVHRLVFQVGSNRGGDKGRPVHPRDDDRQRLRWVSHVLREAGWAMAALGYAQINDTGAVVFRDAPDNIRIQANLGLLSDEDAAEYFTAARLDRFPGEFHRRPLVIAGPR